MRSEAETPDPNADPDDDIERHGERVHREFCCNPTELLELADTRTEFLIPDLIPTDAVALLIGKPGTGKSWIAYDIALAVATGRPFLGIRPAITGPVLVLNYDCPLRELARRWKRMDLRPHDPVAFHSIGRVNKNPQLPDMLMVPDNAADLMALVAFHDPALIIVDSLRAAHFGDENSNREMSAVMRCFRALTASGATVILIHHEGGKGAAPGFEREGVDKSRGASSIPADVDLQLNVTEAALEIAKVRLWNPSRLDYGFKRIDFDNDTRTRLEHFDLEETILDKLTTATPTYGELVEMTGVRVATVKRAVARLIECGYVDEIRKGNKAIRLTTADRRKPRAVA